MRHQRTAALVGVAVLWLALGPWVLLLALASLLHPAVRAWLRPTPRVAAAWVGAVAAAVGIAVVAPAGWLPVPPGPGALVTPAYVGRPVAAQPLLDVAGGPGPRGESPGVTSRWFGWGGRCWGVTAAGDALLARCGSTLRLVGADSLRARDTLDLTAGGAGESDSAGGSDGSDGAAEEPAGACASAFATTSSVASVLGAGGSDGGSGGAAEGDGGEAAGDDAAADLPDAADGTGAVVPTLDRRVLVVAIGDDEGELAVVRDVDVSAAVPAGDCLVSAAAATGPTGTSGAGGDGRLWFVTRDGRVGVVAPDDTVRTTDLGETVGQPLVVAPAGGSAGDPADRSAGGSTGGSTGTAGTEVLVSSTAATYRLALRGGRPGVVWRAAYDRGEEVKDGQPDQGTGTPPVPLAGGLVAVTDNAEPRMHLRVLDARDGSEVCSAALFEDDHSATRGPLVSVGRGVVVANTAGSSGWSPTLLGRAPSGGVARVDVVDGECVERWSTDLVAPSAGAVVSPVTGLVYLPTKRRSWWGADAWYLTAVEAATGHTAFGVRLGLGPLVDPADPTGSPVALGPDGAAYVGTRGGLVRVRDAD
ncbi:hypothetical protein [Nocardioides sp. Leaf307]|uniref:hypothetical protein n=1 Tax=Nocardioides sp. Leaf307 TaxID=1736331 RepID=UPI000702A382|nr:hypothetical protein [Nocardioides sp. Leaf307]KQQ39554.1 hypothetical protein ASF50_16745 [Nocardioides sp. Leaf307]